jgi:hypothetical protein
MLFGVLIVVVVLFGLLYWYLKDYMRTGALKKSALIGNKIPMEREKFIPLLRSAVVASVKAKLGGDGKAVDKLLDKLALTVQLENRALLADLVADFELVDPTASKVQRASVSKERRAAAEQRFLRNFMLMMDKANFKMLTKQELDFAEAEQYLLHIPITSDWEKIDQTLLPAFFDSTDGKKHHTEHAAAVNKRVVVWRRGVGVDQTTGLLLTEKIDVLMERLFEGAAEKLIRTSVWQQLAGEPAPPLAAAPAAADASNVEAVERISLKDQPINVAYFTKPSTIQEPTFKEVVALFRYSETAEKSDPTRDSATLHIKTFRDIPLGDLDIIFPAQKVLFKTVDFFRLAITGVLGLYFAIDQIGDVFRGEGVDVTAMTAAVGFLMFALNTYWNVQWAVDVYKTILSETLYNRSSDSHRGVILYLTEALETQEFKEALIAYAIALQAAAPITEKELDQRCEAFIRAELDAVPPPPGTVRARTPSVDFEVDDATDKIIRFGLARATGERDARIITALPVNEALLAIQKYVSTLTN